MMCCSEQNTNGEEMNVVVDEIFHNTGLFRCTASRLKQAGRESTCQTRSFHLVYVRAALNPSKHTHKNICSSLVNIEKTYTRANHTV